MPEYLPGQNPNSLANLRPAEMIYDEPKRDHTVTVTDTAWAALKTAASSHGSSRSELVEQYARWLDEGNPPIGG